jgi:hypothetical protein
MKYNKQGKALTLFLKYRFRFHYQYIQHPSENNMHVVPYVIHY